MVNSVPDNAAPKQDSGRKLFYGLFIFPLLIAAGMAVILCSAVLLTRETQTPESLIAEIKTGTPSKRWQKAFELSNELNQGRGMVRSSGVMKEVIHILNHRREYDAKTRSYMAVALTHFDDPEVIPALSEALRNETEADVELFLLWALGVKGAKEAEEEVRAYLKHESSDLRQMAAYVLGPIGSEKSIGPLSLLIGDASQDVRWNAALSLAQLGSDAGYNELLQMIDRRSLEAQGELPPDKIEEIMGSAIKGLALLGRHDAVPIIEEIARGDENLKVRQAAINYLQQLREGAQS